MTTPCHSSHSGAPALTQGARDSIQEEERSTGLASNDLLPSSQNVVESLERGVNLHTAGELRPNPLGPCNTLPEGACELILICKLRFEYHCKNRKRSILLDVRSKKIAISQNRNESENDYCRD